MAPLLNSMTSYNSDAIVLPVTRYWTSTVVVETTESFTHTPSVRRQGDCFFDELGRVMGLLVADRWTVKKHNKMMRRFYQTVLTAQNVNDELVEPMVDKVCKKMLNAGLKLEAGGKISKRWRLRIRKCLLVHLSAYLEARMNDA